VVVEVVVLFVIDGVGPEVMFFPIKCVEVSGRAEHFSDPGGWIMKLEEVRAERREVVVVWQCKEERKE
jgi:hypothetical protein